ncbi:hypothetical protein LIER_34372 [Lithospermum erythrorhizon]|uniref:Reverse transcriptase domain-containing protein n=1 Tax=Lithospermum erythrorhizon TaxID=34254 RepID=A0AAV3S2T3_LITER
MILAQETTHHIRISKCNKNGLVAIKVDMSKIFDRNIWDFVIAVLKKLNFPDHWLNLVFKCLSSVKYSVLVNGHTSNVLTPSCGVRQGDPLSPILFSICTEALLASLIIAMNNKDIKGVSIARNDPPLTHLLFADDSSFFLNLDLKSISVFVDTLSSYYKDSGQIINNDKSQIFFSPFTPTFAKNRTISTINVKESNGFGKYLGIPLDITINRKQIFVDIIDKIKK